MLLTASLSVLALGLPSQMPALVANSALSKTYGSFKTPVLGDLHSRYSGLPNSCEVLVAVNYSSINPADRYASPPFPQVMGSDIGAVVIKTQPSCTRLKVGDKVNQPVAPSPQSLHRY